MSLLRPAQLHWLGACLLLLAACGGGDDDVREPTATPAPAGTQAAAKPTPQWPEVARGTITTEDLNVRTGPGGTYPVVGRLQPGDEVPVSARLAGGQWLALPGIGWIAYAEDWVRLGADFKSLPQVTEPDRAFEFAGPVYPADARSGIPVVDQVVAAVASRDRNLLIRLAAATAPVGSTTPTATATSLPTLVPDTTEVPATATPVPRPAPRDCAGEPIAGDRLRDYLDALYRTAVPSAAKGGDGQGVLRLYGVVRGPAPPEGSADYVVVFAFEGGEGRQLWVSTDGSITRFTIPCEPTLPGTLLRVTGGEPFFWSRPPVTPPVRPLP